jgi:hypothetical protein
VLRCVALCCLLIVLSFYCVVLSCVVLCGLVLCCVVLSCLAWSFLFFSCLAVSCLVLWCHVLSLAWLVLSCLVSSTFSIRFSPTYLACIRIHRNPNPKPYPDPNQMCGAASFLPPASATSASSKASQLRMKCSQMLCDLGALIMAGSASSETRRRLLKVVMTPESPLWLVRPHPYEDLYIPMLLGKHATQKEPEVLATCRCLMAASRVLDAGWLLLSDVTVAPERGHAIIKQELKQRLATQLIRVDHLLKGHREQTSGTTRTRTPNVNANT